MKSNRRKLREKILQILYAYELSGNELTEIIKEQFPEIKNENDLNFVYGIINYITENKTELDEIIKKRLVNWEVYRIAIIDRLLLQIGIAEFLFAEDIPTKVTINEIIEIAKEFSMANSGKFINGILDAVLIDLKKEGKIKKVGRGLIEKSNKQKS